MFPIRDHNPSGRTPYVTIALMAANILVFCAYWLTLTDGQIGWFLYTWGIVPGRLMAGQGIETLVTHMFVHAGWMHLAGNMLFLWIYGDNLESEMGHGGFLLFYLAAGLAAAGLQSAADPWSDIPMVGASGAIAGVMGGYLLLYPRAKVDVLFIFVIFFRIFPIPAWIVLGLWFGIQMVSGLAVPSDEGGVAYLAHIGGFVAGVIFALPVWLRRGAAAYWQRTEGHPPHPETAYKLSRSRIPTVRR
ncbi:MAG: rhomboid family intramembrane serine protease [Pseudomonadota bacterium]